MGTFADSTRYRLSFPAGFQDLIARLLLRDQPGAHIVETDESALIMAVPEKTQFLPPQYLQGAALVIDSVDVGGRDLAAIYRTFAARLDSTQACRRSLERVFRDPAFCKGKPAGAGPVRFAVRGFVGATATFPGQTARADLESAVRLATGAQADSARPAVELAVHLRRNGRAFLTAGFGTGRRAPAVPVANAPTAGRRASAAAAGAALADAALADAALADAAPTLTASADPAPSAPPAGALAADIARLLCELSNPQPGDVFLDPFMGSGSIVVQRALMAPFAMIFANDADAQCVTALKQRLKEPAFERRRKRIFPKNLDAAAMTTFEDGFFSAVVTDPPWGHWQTMTTAARAELYGGFLREMQRVCRRDARLVVLVGREVTGETPGEPPAEAAATTMERAATGIWGIEEYFDILVSGRKARVLVLVPKLCTGTAANKPGNRV